MPQVSFLTASGLVALGGGLGAWLRFVVGFGWIAVLGGPRASGFPFAILTVNVLGSLVMGLIMGWIGRHADTAALEPARLLFAVGLCGGFTTFSSFSLDIVALVQRGQAGLALFYVATSLVAGVAALFLGLTLMRSAA